MFKKNHISVNIRNYSKHDNIIGIDKNAIKRIQGAIIMEIKDHIKMNRHQPVAAHQLSIPESILTLELVPKTLWYKNLRSVLPKSIWDKLRKNCYEKANHHCEVCDGQGKIHKVECNEIWEYDDQNKVQKLVGLVALCELCHKVKHLGLTELQGQKEIALRHMAAVNKWDEDACLQYVKKCFDKWQERSRFEWQQDLNWLTNRGINLNQLKKVIKENEIIETKLWKAINDKDISAIKDLANKNEFNLQDRDNKGKHLLHQAVSSRQDNIVDLMLTNDEISKLIDVKDKNGVTPLILAIKCKSFTITKKLIEAGANKNIIDHHKRTILHHAVIENQAEILEYLLQSDISTLMPLKDSFGKLFFHCITKKEFKTSVKPLLEIDTDVCQEILQLIIKYTEKGLLLEKDKYGKNFLHYLAIYADEGLLESYFNRYSQEEIGTLLNALDKYGKSPINQAAIYGNKAALRFFLLKGAKFDHVTHAYSSAVNDAKNILGEDEATKIFSPYIPLSPNDEDPEKDRFEQNDNSNNLLANSNSEKYSATVFHNRKQAAITSKIPQINSAFNANSQLDLVSKNRLMATNINPNLNIIHSRYDKNNPSNGDIPFNVLNAVPNNQNIQSDIKLVLRSKEKSCHTSPGVNNMKEIIYLTLDEDNSMDELPYRLLFSPIKEPSRPYNNKRKYEVMEESNKQAKAEEPKYKKPHI